MIIPAFYKGQNKLMEITSLQQLKELKENTKDKVIALLFWANWYPECEEIRKIFKDRCIDHNHTRFAWVIHMLILYSAMLMSKRMSLKCSKYNLYPQSFYCTYNSKLI